MSLSRLSIAAVMLLYLALLGACGGSSPRPDPLSGPFVQVTGASSKTFSLAQGAVTTRCLDKPGLKEFEYEATSNDSKNKLHLIFKNYSPGDFELEYGVSKPQHLISVQVDTEYKYKFFQHLRTDTNEIHASYCKVSTTSEETATGNRYTGLLNCTLLWADAASKDYSGSSNLNNFVDINVKFECER